jgi:hypothetical protein
VFLQIKRLKQLSKPKKLRRDNPFLCTREAGEISPASSFFKSNKLFYSTPVFLLLAWFMKMQAMKNKNNNLMSNKIFRVAGTAALILVAQLSFAQVNLGSKSSTNVGAKVNPSIANKTAAATKSAASSTAQKAKEVKAQTSSTVRESARVNGSVNANANANANAKENANENSVLSAGASTQTSAEVDATGAVNKGKEVKEKTKGNADKAKTKIKDKADDTKVKVKEARPSVDGSIKAESKVKAKSGN